MSDITAMLLSTTLGLMAHEKCNGAAFVCLRGSAGGDWHSWTLADLRAAAARFK